MSVSPSKLERLFHGAFLQNRASEEPEPFTTHRLKDPATGATQTYYVSVEGGNIGKIYTQRSGDKLVGNPIGEIGFDREGNPVRQSAQFYEPTSRGYMNAHGGALKDSTSQTRFIQMSAILATAGGMNLGRISVLDGVNGANTQNSLKAMGAKDAASLKIAIQKNPALAQSIETGLRELIKRDGPGDRAMVTEFLSTYGIEAEYGLGRGMAAVDAFTASVAASNTASAPSARTALNNAANRSHAPSDARLLQATLALHGHRIAIDNARGPETNRVLASVLDITVDQAAAMPTDAAIEAAQQAFHTKNIDVARTLANIQGLGTQGGQEMLRAGLIALGADPSETLDKTAMIATAEKYGVVITTKAGGALTAEFRENAANVDAAPRPEIEFPQLGHLR